MVSKHSQPKMYLLFFDVICLIIKFEIHWKHTEVPLLDREMAGRGSPLAYAPGRRDFGEIFYTRQPKTYESCEGLHTEFFLPVWFFHTVMDKSLHHNFTRVYKYKIPTYKKFNQSNHLGQVMKLVAPYNKLILFVKWINISEDKSKT